MKKNKKPHWYFHRNLKPQGPFSEEEMRTKILRGEVGPLDLICNEKGVWRPASEWGHFELQLFPASQGFTAGSDLAEDLSVWVLLVPGNKESADGKHLQEGPFTVAELTHLLEAGIVTPYQYIWKNGLSGWCQIKDRPEFQLIITSELLDK